MRIASNYELFNMADTSNPCVDKNLFQTKITELKEETKSKDSNINFYVEDNFYEKAKMFLKQKKEQAVGLEIQNPVQLSKSDQNTINRKKWSFANEKLWSEEGKEVIPKSQIYDALSFAHARIAHRGRQKTWKWVKDNYTEINQNIINCFVQMCRVHAEQKTITDRVKEVKQPLSSKQFLNLIEMDLMDFRNCPCSCVSIHKWVINIIDHHTKFCYMLPIHSKTAEEVVGAFSTFCMTYGYPKKVLTDNGLEFRNNTLETYAKQNGIQIVHGSPRTPTT